MTFDDEDFDWAIGELLALFSNAARTHIPPHIQNPQLFHAAWILLNGEPFETRRLWYRRLMAIYRPENNLVRASPLGKRYEYTHIA